MRTSANGHDPIKTVPLLVIGTDHEASPALAAMVAQLPARFPLAVVISQPRDEDGTDNLLATLARESRLPLAEPDDKEEILAGHVYVAPAGYHLLVDRGFFCLSREPAVRFQRPAAAPTFASAAEACGADATAVLLTRRSVPGGDGSPDDAAGGAAVLQFRDDVTTESTTPLAALPAAPWAAATVWLSGFVSHVMLRAGHAE